MQRLFRKPLHVAFQAITLAFVLMIGISDGVQAQDGPDDPNIVYDPVLFEGLDFRMIGPSRGQRSTTTLVRV